jgi:hypothetical protein
VKANRLFHMEHSCIGRGAIPAASTNFPLQIKGIFFPAKAAYGWIRPDSSRLRQLDGSLPVCERNTFPLPMLTAGRPS